MKFTLNWLPWDSIIIVGTDNRYPQQNDNHYPFLNIEYVSPSTVINKPNTKIPVCQSHTFLWESCPKYFFFKQNTVTSSMQFRRRVVWDDFQSSFEMSLVLFIYLLI